MPHRICSRLALVAATSLISTAALAAEPKITNFAVADAITNVQLCGNRNHGSKKAEQPYRVLLAEQNGQSILLVQWMNQPEGAEHWRAVAAHTLGFSEINDDKAGLTLHNLRCSTQGKSIKLTANVTGGPKTNKRRSMQLVVGPELEKYEIKFTPALK
ncbi:MAG: hypothetical protein RSD57_15815 [Comamonas sp.]